MANNLKSKCLELAQIEFENKVAKSKKASKDEQKTNSVIDTASVKNSVKSRSKKEDHEIYKPEERMQVDLRNATALYDFLDS